ncbi:hypothetical protein BD414DRAFT_167712 [Trametes punicea]|nr:hypothetical protein BD414DRAFT_167712 [Trametes punicea]
MNAVPRHHRDRRHDLAIADCDDGIVRSELQYSPTEGSQAPLLRPLRKALNKQGLQERPETSYRVSTPQRGATAAQVPPPVSPFSFYTLLSLCHWLYALSGTLGIVAAGRE